MSTPVVVSRIQNRRGTQSQFDALYPVGYSGVGGFGSGIFTPSYTLVNYPSVLMPGELALCTDSRNIFIGNLNGEYIQIADLSSASGLQLSPVQVDLIPEATFTVIPNLQFQITPFFTILYSMTDNPSTNWNSVGTNFSRNGELQITAVSGTPPSTTPPIPPANPVTLTDIGTEINLSLPNTISFMAQYDGFGNIQILYMHNFSVPITFSSTTLQWLPF
jgi:hypothetical protein